MKRLLVIFIILLPLAVCASPKSNKWFSGLVVFHTGDTLHCDLRFTRKVTEGLIQVKAGDRIEVLTVKDVRAFSFYDDGRGYTRTFFNLAVIPDLSTRKHEIFIELLYATKTFSILNHKSLGYSENAIQINPFRKKAVVNQRYIFNNATGEVVPLTRDNILMMMAERKTEVVGYLESNNVRLKTVDDYIALLDFHAKLF
jgi:hypothetical protein